MSLLVAAVLLALTVSALCSVLEATLLSLTPSQVADLSERRPRLGKIWQGFKDNIDRPIAVILILNTAAHTIGATIAGAQFELLFGPQGIFLFGLVFTYFMLQFTEILPKTLGVRYNRQVAGLAALPLAFLVRLLRPVIAFVHLVNKPFEPKADARQPAATLEEISALAGLARLSKLISPEQERIIRGTSLLSKKKAGDVMLPVEEVAFLSSSRSLEEAITDCFSALHTRFPICDGGNRDKVLGYVNFKEMVFRSHSEPDRKDLRGIIRPVRFVDPGAEASGLLKLFVKRHEHMAIVREAGGRTLGLITLEDVIEELVGEIEDEFDSLPRLLRQVDEGAWRVGGGVPVAELAKRAGIAWREPEGTVASWFARQSGKAPEINQSVETQEFRLTVRRVRRGRIYELLLERKAAGNG